MQKKEDETQLKTQFQLGLIRDIHTKRQKLREREARLLGTIIEMESGNIYNIWKASGLKHYPTVLRVVKKLEQKKMVEMLSQNGERGEKICSPTLLGSFTYFILQRDANKLIETISRESQAFRDLLNANLLGDYSQIVGIWVRRCIAQFMWDFVRQGNEQSIDDIVRNSLFMQLSEDILDIQTQDHKNDLIHFAKLEWIREFILEEMETQIRQDTEHVKRLQAFKKTLMPK